MVPASCLSTDAVPPPPYQRARQAAARPAPDRRGGGGWSRLVAALPGGGRRRAPALPPPLPASRRGRTRTYSEASLLLLALLRTTWRLSYADLHAWLVAWPALTRACGLPDGPDGRPRVPSPSQQCKREAQAGWSAVARRVALTYAATLVVALTAQQHGRPDLIRSPKRVLAHLWEGPL